jgi:hypothetical protein
MNVRFHGTLILEMGGNDDPNVAMTNACRGRSYLKEISRSLALGCTVPGAKAVPAR